MDLKTLKENRKMFDDECSVEILSTRNKEEFLATCMKVDFDRTVATVDVILEQLGLDTDLGNKLVEEMENLSETLAQCYESSVVNDMLDRGYVYFNGVFSNGHLEIPFDSIMYHEIDDAIAMAEQLKEIKNLDEREKK